MIDAVDIDFCMAWRWGGWPLFHNYLGACVAPYSIDYTAVPIWWDGLPT
jgi:hypothetical protein